MMPTPSFARRCVVAKYSVVRKLGAFHLMPSTYDRVRAADDLSNGLDCRLVRMQESRHEAVDLGAGLLACSSATGPRFGGNHGGTLRCPRGDRQVRTGCRKDRRTGTRPVLIRSEVDRGTAWPRPPRNCHRCSRAAAAGRTNTTWPRRGPTAGTSRRDRARRSSVHVLPVLQDRRKIEADANACHDDSPDKRAARASVRSAGTKLCTLHPIRTMMLHPGQRGGAAHADPASVAEGRWFALYCAHCAPKRVRNGPGVQG